MDTNKILRLAMVCLLCIAAIAGIVLLIQHLSN